VNLGEKHENPGNPDSDLDYPDLLLRSTFRFNAASITFPSLSGQTRQIGDSRCQNDLLGLLPRTPLRIYRSPKSLK